MPLKVGRVSMNAFEGLHAVVPTDCLMFVIQLLLVVKVSMHSTHVFNLLNMTKRNALLLISFCKESITRDVLTDLHKLHFSPNELLLCGCG